MVFLALLEELGEVGECGLKVVARETDIVHQIGELVAYHVDERSGYHLAEHGRCAGEAKGHVEVCVKTSAFDIETDIGNGSVVEQNGIVPGNEVKDRDPSVAHGKLVLFCEAACGEGGHLCSVVEGCKCMA